MGRHELSKNEIWKKLALFKKISKFQTASTGLGDEPKSPTALGTVTQSVRLGLKSFWHFVISYVKPKLWIFF